MLKSFEDKEIFLDAILNLPAPNDNLKKAQLRYNQKKAGIMEKLAKRLAVTKDKQIICLNY